MDIKTLLLKSLSAKKPIWSSRRIYFGKSCFIIKYVVKGKMLTIKSIKNTSSKCKTWPERIKYYHWAYKRYHKKQSNLSTTHNILYEDKETFTLEVPTLTKEVQTECSNIYTITKTTSTQYQMLVAITSSAQQTLASALFNRKTVYLNQISSLVKSSKTCQTDLINTECRAVQCKRFCLIKATNTDENTRNSSTQTDLFVVATSPDKSCEPLALESSGKDLDVLIYMLNEIGEIVINQNQLLNNNSEMMKQIMQVNMLPKSKSLESASR
ncbi:uncharacterized protein LOC135949889 [Calliphora vicina]|uniref:uncharacterized protein LOC135949889 n=1 Tax=Calliphora vicina TaxID=7373 RepID=UPI00325A6343